jgi:leucine dehydrogenase
MNSDYPEHELVTSRQELVTGLTAYIAIHNSRLGPAIGGCRIQPYANTAEAVDDVLRLSRGMTYKAAIAAIPYGGGKAVIVADPVTQKTPVLLHAMGDFVESLNGRYITSFDAGTTLEDVRTMAERTRFTAGTLAEAGNASVSTALGVYECLKVAARIQLGRSDLEGLRVAIQGIGNVGRRLADLLRDAGATLTIADVHEGRVAQAAAELQAQIVPCDHIHRVEADIFAPCALGGSLSRKTIGELRVKAVIGGANNQLASPQDDRHLMEAGILYCPDYLANAGGIVDVHYQRASWSAAAIARHIGSLAETFQEVIDRSRATGEGTGRVADRIAEQRFRGAGRL